MVRFRDAALVASLFGAMPVLAGTSIAKSEGMDTPVLSPASIPVTGEAASAPAAEGTQGVFEALIADFRHGAPEMGAVPHLPVPPPHRMRVEEAAESGGDAPRGGNVALADTNVARHREPAVATPTDTVRVADRPPPPATPTNAPSTPTPPALASAIERAVNAAVAMTRPRDAARDARAEVRSSRAMLDTAT